MQLNLTETQNQELTQAAHFCSLSPERLAHLFVVQGIEMYCMHDDALRELRENLSGETE